MNTLQSCIMTAFVLAGISNLANADNDQVVTARLVNNIQEMQAESIRQGIKIGKLTPREASKLRDEQFEIRSLEEAMRANGSLDAEELSELFKRLEASRNNINKLLRNHISTHYELDDESPDMSLVREANS